MCCNAFAFQLFKFLCRVCIILTVRLPVPLLLFQLSKLLWRVCIILVFRFAVMLLFFQLFKLLWRICFVLTFQFAIMLLFFELFKLPVHWFPLSLLELPECPRVFRISTKCGTSSLFPFKNVLPTSNFTDLERFHRFPQNSIIFLNLY